MKTLKHGRMTAILLLSLGLGFLPSHAEPGASHMEKALLSETKPSELSITDLEKAKEGLDRKVVTASNLFGADLLQSIVKSDATGNVVIAPTSADFCLSMVLDGAAGTTRNAMLKTLRLDDLSDEKRKTTVRSMLQLGSSADPDVTISAANSIWTDSKSHVKPAFLSCAATAYGADVKSADFHSPETKKQINDWVAARTANKISSIVDEIKPEVKMILLNAVYFHGLWSTPFKESATMPRVFTSLNGKESRIPMMNQTQEHTAYMQRDGYQLIKLPYGADRKYQLWIFLSDSKVSSSTSEAENTTAHNEFLSRVLHEDWTRLDDSFADQEVHVCIPKLKIETKKSFKKSLEGMGMSIAFDREKADFANMFDLSPNENAYIDDVIQKTFFEMNEKGTEAAAATEASMGLFLASTRAPARPKEFVADRPFVLGIRNQESGEILFIGSITNLK